MTSRERQALETKSKIVRAALNLLKIKGYESLKVRDICAEAAVSTGAFYHYFDSKDAIIQVAAGSYDEQLEDLLKTFDASDALSFLRFILVNQAEYIMMVTESFHISKEFYGALFSMKNDYIFNRDRTYYKAIRRQVEKCLEDGTFSGAHTAEYLTNFFYRTIRGEIFDWCLHDYGYNLVEQVKTDLDIIIPGLCNEL